MSRKDLVKEIVATAAPIFIKKALKYLAAGKTLSEDDIASEVIAECEELPQHADTVQYVGQCGNLVSTLCLIIDDLASDIKMQITQEVMMKLYIELDRVKTELNDVGAAKCNDIFGGLPQFDVTEDAPIFHIKSGYESVASYAPTRLENTPLFALPPSIVHAATHTVEDFNTAGSGGANSEGRYTRYNSGMSRRLCEDIVDTDIIGGGSSSAANTSIKGNNTNAQGNSITTDTDIIGGSNIDIANSVHPAGNNFNDVRKDISANDDLWGKMFADKYGGN